MKIRFTWVLAFSMLFGTVLAADKPLEIHDRIASTMVPSNRLTLTLNACSGTFDDDLIEFLIRNYIPATLFAERDLIRVRVIFSWAKNKVKTLSHHRKSSVS